MSDQTAVYKHVPHPRTTAILEHLSGGPVRTKDVAAAKIATKVNSWLAVKITDGVGTMWCAYVFAVIALIGLPTALRPGGEGIIAWIAQTFLQLVLLSIIIVGQNIAAEASDRRSENTFKDAEAILSEALAIQKHLLVQDRLLVTALAALNLDVPVDLDTTPPSGGTPDPSHGVPGVADGTPPS
ncbi:MAG: hypothetical protein ACYDHU_10585 [Acidimicrobiales bacterium]